MLSYALRSKFWCVLTNHGVEGQSKNGTFGFRGTGFFSGSLTTIRPRITRKIRYNQIEGGLAHCSIYDTNNNLLILNESVLNGEAYKLIRFGEHIILEPKGFSQNIFWGL